jgi:hypothetical protein
MNGSVNRQSERGVALFAVLFALLLLSVIGLGMMYATNTETAINSNYRDAQVALYAAMAGLQEARDRIQPATLHITPPTDVPSLSAQNVIYIINPKTGETVTPWDLTSRYADTELCWERILSLTGTIGTPCTTIASGSSWYRTYDDSNSSTAGVWKLTNPLDWKWVRIALKTNNMAPIAANNNVATTNQVCWDGKNQILLPTGYGAECVRVGSVVSVLVNNSGSGYTSAPTVTIGAPASGQTATATANMELVTQQMVTSITVTNGGSGYAEKPIVTLVGGTGSGATAHVGDDFIPANGAPVASISLAGAGTRCYASAPAVAFTGGGGSGAAAAATLAASNSCIADVSFNGPCSAHKSETVAGIGLSGASGSGFAATVTFNSNGTSTGVTITNSGNGYTAAPTNITNINGCGTMTFTATLGKRVSAVSLTSGGSGYSSVPTVSFTTGTGTTQTQPAATASLGAIPPNAGKVLSVVVDTNGTAYNPGAGGAPSVVFTAASGSGAAATANLAPVGGTNYYKVASVTVNSPGYGYTSAPSVSFSGGGGSGATAQATVGMGSNYGKIHVLTAFAQTSSDARAMMQMEVAGPPTGYHDAGALTVDGPNPTISNFANSNQFYINGNDQNTCGDAYTEPTRPAVGTYDNPDADPPTHSLSTMIGVANVSPGPDHYVGDGGNATTPSVQNVYATLGETMGTPTGLKAIIDAVNANKTNTGNTVSLGSAASPQINYIDGNLTLAGSNTGYGVLVVTGRLEMDGNFSWKGTILVVGDGIFDFSGGGNGTIYGSMVVAKIWDGYATKNLLSSLGSPSMNWNGGGGNGIYYDHCWAWKMMSKVPVVSPPSTKPLRVLSVRTLP